MADLDASSGKWVLVLSVLLTLCCACAGADLLIQRKAEGKAVRVCENACMPRAGAVVGDTCYCENEGLAFVPVDMLIPDTGLCGSKGVP